MPILVSVRFTILTRGSISEEVKGAANHAATFLNSFFILVGSLNCEVLPKVLRVGLSCLGCLKVFVLPL